MTYPRVLGEFETLERVASGRSLARFGDGEFAMASGADMKSQRFDHQLQRRLRDILIDSGECLIGVPNIHTSIKTPKRTSWDKHMARGESLLSPNRPYVSAFISRPDSAPWIDTPEYWGLLESLWIGKDVVVVRGGEKSLMPSDLVGARSVREVVGPSQHAWSDYSRLVAEVGTPDGIVLLCLGATATVMAVDLCALGVHAVDLGHVGMFLRKHRRGEPMWLTKADKDRVAVNR